MIQAILPPLRFEFSLVDNVDVGNGVNDAVGNGVGRLRVGLGDCSVCWHAENPQYESHIPAKKLFESGE